MKKWMMAGMLCMMISVPTFAEKDFALWAPFSEESEVHTDGEYEYVILADDSVEIIKYIDQGVEELTVPEEIDDHEIYSIGEKAFCDCKSLRSITLPEGVTFIKDNAFEGCENLSSVVLSEGLAHIEEFAFWGCESLSSINFPEGLTKIGNWAFIDCDNLSSVTLPVSINTLGSNPFARCDNIHFDVSTDHPYLEVIDGVLFSKPDKKLICCPDRQAYIVPDGIENIGDNAFDSCESLTSVTLPEEVASIGNFAFLGCINLSSITLPEGLTSIGDFAFRDCKSLSSITLPEGLTSIWNYPFDGCDNLAIFVVQDSYAHQYCIDHGLSYKYTDSLD